MINWLDRVKTITNGQINKSLGQNFLINYEIIRNILKSVTFHSHVLEIGAGMGILSWGIIEFLTPGSFFTIVEKDQRFVDQLEILLRPWAQERSINLTIIHGDGLEYMPSEPVQVISNIPYNIASLLFYHWLSHSHKFCSLVIMIQKEMAEKLTKNYKNNPNYSHLSVLIQGLGTVKTIMTLAPSSFIPQPKVYSQVIYYNNQINDSWIVNNLIKLLNESFSFPRKQLHNNIKTMEFKWVMINQGWEKLRPENLSPQQYIQWIKLLGNGSM
jgi:16S rRNA (adenine1518-N6/adenine1519-N6)-dimethyltransferase